MSLTFWTDQQILQQLDSGEHWSGSTWTYGFPTVSWNNFTTNGEPDGFSPLNNAQIHAATLAIHLWDDLISPDFSRQLNANGVNTEIEFGNSTSGVGFAHAYFPSAHPSAGGVWFNPQFDVSQGTNNLLTPQIGQHGFTTYIHEIGHALGLRHMGNYNGSGTTIDDRTSIQDDTLYSVMSYFEPSQTGSADWRAADGQLYRPQTPMLSDVLAIQTIYGAETTTRTGNTVYGFGSNITGDLANIYDFSINAHPILTLYDAGGIDTLNLSGFSTPSIIDLTPGSFSSADAMTLNIAIAGNTFIENAVGGAGRDTLNGNSLANVLKGKGGDDVLSGGSGDDRLIGGAGSDTIDGGDGANDVAVFSGDFSSFSIVFAPSTASFTISDAAGAQVDVVTGVEQFEFTDITLSAAELGQQQEVTVAVAALSAAQLEGNGGSTAFTFNVTLSQALSSTQTVAYEVSGSGAAAADSADFAGGLLPSGTVTFSAGQTSQTITVLVAGDATIEADETFTLFLSDPSPAITLGAAAATGTIGNDDTALPFASIAAATESQLEADSGATNYNFTVSLNQAVTSTQTLSYHVSGSGQSPAGDADFVNGVLPSGVLTFTAGQSSQSISVAVAGDTIIEADESFTVTLSAPSAGLLLADSTALGRILDDDTLTTDGDDYPNNTSTAGFVSVNGAASSGRIEAGMDSDWFRVNLTAGQSYTFDLSSAADNGLNDPFLSLFDSNGTFIAHDDDSGTKLNSRLTFTAPDSGTFFLEAADANALAVGTGNYRISAVSFSGADDFAGNTTTTGMITIGGPASQGEIEVGFDSDWFRVDLTAGRTYTFTLSRTEVHGLIDPYLSLYDSSGGFIAFNDDSGGDANAQLRFTALNSGAFFLGAEDFDVGTGSYTIAATLGVMGSVDDDKLKGGPDNDTFDGGDGNDTLIGRGGSDILSGNSGDDKIIGGSGNDILNGDAGDDVLRGGAGSDALQGGAGIDKLKGGGGDDTLDGGDGDDKLDGNAGDDILNGGNGDDVLSGHKGEDTLDGGNGSDIYIVSSNEDSADAYHDSGSGSNDIDILDAAKTSLLYLGGDFVNSGLEVIQGADNGTVLAANSPASVWDFSDTSLINIRKIVGSQSADQITGSVGNDRIKGLNGNDVLNGGEGNDKAIGGRGDDSINGGGGHDVVKGGAGDDKLNGGDGNDRLIGGGQDDTFIFDTELSSANVDTIVKFDSADDVIVLDSAIFSSLITPGGNALAASEFVANSSGMAEDTDDRIIYNTNTGELFYDADGSGGSFPVQFALLTTAPVIDTDDFFVAN